MAGPAAEEDQVAAHVVGELVPRDVRSRDELEDQRWPAASGLEGVDVLVEFTSPEYAKAAKLDAPSGTARELADRLADVRAPQVDLPVDQVAGHPEARGAVIAGAEVHSVRVPSFVVSTEIVFGAHDERLGTRHDAGGAATPYVTGVLLAVARAATSARSRAWPACWWPDRIAVTAER